MTVFVKSLLYLLIISDINIDKVINYKTAVRETLRKEVVSLKLL